MPIGPVATAYTLLIIVAAVLCAWQGGRDNLAIAGALLLSSVSAVLATWTSSLWILAGSLPVCALIVIQGRTVACVVMAALYAARLLLLSLAFLGVLSTQAFWNWNEVPLVLQILIAYANVLAPPVARSAYKRGYDVRHLRNYISFMNRAL